jgi:dihydroorotase
LDKLTLRRPDDWHLHLRDGEALRSVLPFTAERFARAIVMPNLKPAVTTTAQALAYRQRILDALPAGMKFEPLMTNLPKSTARRPAATYTDSNFTPPGPRRIPTPALPTFAKSTPCWLA